MTTVNQQFTLHLRFLADEPVRAREFAAAMAEARGILRPEVDTYSASVSSVVAWVRTEPVFCLTDLPDDAFCTDVAGHPGRHSTHPVGARPS